MTVYMKVEKKGKWKILLGSRNFGENNHLCLVKKASKWNDL